MGMNRKTPMESVHSSVCRYIPVLLRSGNADADMTSALLRQLWFLLDIVIKSMGQQLLIDDMHKVQLLCVVI